MLETAGALVITVLGLFGLCALAGLAMFCIKLFVDSRID